MPRIVVASTVAGALGVRTFTSQGTEYPKQQWSCVPAHSEINLQTITKLLGVLRECCFS